MAVITQNTGVSATKTPQALTRTVLTASDTFTFQRGSRQFIHIRNNAGSTFTAVFTGSAPSQVGVPGLGGVVDGTAGLSAAITANAGIGLVLDLDQFFIYFGDGTVTLTGVSGCAAVLWN